jgi:LmbE family N-acetylglucosaminyl deacetylase
MISSIKRFTDICVIYVFSKSDWTNPEACSGVDKHVDNVTAIRKQEERNVSAILEYRCHYLDLLDYPLRTDIPASRTEALIIEHLATLVGKNDLIFFPLGLCHPDHVLVSTIGFRFMRRGYQTLFYEDLPYAAFNHAEMQELGRRKHLQRCPVDIAIHDKINVLSMYRSQMSPSWIENVTDHAFDLASGRYREYVWIPERNIQQVLPHLTGRMYVPAAMGK